MTIATVVCIFKPLAYNVYITRSFVKWTIVITTILALNLNIILPVVHKVGLNKSSRPSDQRYCRQLVTFYSVTLRSHFMFRYLESAYYFAHSATVIVVPIALMSISTVLICRKYRVSRELGTGVASARKRTVLRITFVTTLCHLIFEGPALCVFAMAAIRGSRASRHEDIFCLLHVVTNFLSAVNATIPFFLFLCCNQQFRREATLLFNSSFPGNTRSNLSQVQNSPGNDDSAAMRLANSIFYDDAFHSPGSNSESENEELHQMITNV